MFQAPTANLEVSVCLPNSTFELTPPDPTVAISALNPMPYWDVQNYSDNVMTATSVFDSTTNLAC